MPSHSQPLKDLTPEHKKEMVADLNKLNSVLPIVNPEFHYYRFQELCDGWFKPNFSFNDVQTAIEFAFATDVERHIPSKCTRGAEYPLLEVIKIYISLLAGESINPLSEFKISKDLTEVMLLLMDKALLQDYGQWIFHSIGYHQVTDFTNRLRALLSQEKVEKYAVEELIKSFETEELIKSFETNSYQPTTQFTKSVDTSSPIAHRFALALLKNNNITDSRFLLDVKAHLHPLILAKMIIILKDTNLLNNNEYYDLILTHKDVFNLLIALKYSLDNNKSISENNFLKIIKHRDPQLLATFFASVKKLDIYNHSTFLLLDHPQFVEITNCLALIARRHSRKNLPFTVLQQLIDHPKKSVVCDLLRILGPDHFNNASLKNILELPNPEEYLRIFIVMEGFAAFDLLKAEKKLLKRKTMPSCLQQYFTSALVERLFGNSNAAEEVSIEDYFMLKRLNFLDKTFCVLYDACLNSPPDKIVDLLLNYKKEDFFIQLSSPFLMHCINLAYDNQTLLHKLKPYFNSFGYMEFFNNEKTRAEWRKIFSFLSSGTRTPISIDPSLWLGNILKEENVEALEAKANRFFEFLPLKQREKAIFLLLSRLQNNLSADERVAVEPKKRKHEELYAFSILKEFSQKHRKIDLDASVEAIPLLPRSFS